MNRDARKSTQCGMSRTGLLMWEHARSSASYGKNIERVDGRTNIAVGRRGEAITAIAFLMTGTSFISAVSTDSESILFLS